jgi:tetratricopeptide (TPR) repeat protein
MMAMMRNRASSLLRLGFRYGDVLVVALAALFAAGYWLSQRPERQFTLALADVERQDWSAVRRRAAALEQSADHFAQAQLLWAIAEIHDNQLMEAIEDLQTAIEHPQTKPLAYAYAGEAWFKLRHYVRAEQSLLASHADLPNRADTHRWLAALYYDTGAMGNAMVHLTRTAELAPADPRPHRLIGLINKDFENFEPAVAAYQESLRRDPRQPDRETVLLELADSQVRARQFQDGLKTLAQCRQSAHRRVLEAECHFALDDKQRAKSVLTDVLAQTPNRPDALVVLGGILLDEGDLPGAVRALTRCLDVVPLDYTARYRLGQAYQRQGNQAEASKHGKIAEDMKRLREEFNDLHHQAIAKPQDAEIRYQLGVTATKLHQPELAHSWFQATLALDPSHKAAASAIQALESGAKVTPTPTSVPVPPGERK